MWRSWRRRGGSAVLCQGRRTSDTTTQHPRSTNLARLRLEEEEGPRGRRAPGGGGGSLRLLQQVGEPQAEQPQHASGAVQPGQLERGRPRRGGRAGLAGRARVDVGAVGRRAGAGRRRRRRGVGRLGVQGAAGVVVAAGGRARVVLAARRHALGAPLGAHEVRQRQRVLGDVGLGAVAAEAAVREGVL